ncbi:MAG: 6-hydroxymethylpterin diphosphokinase MptE-like protein [bacterium]
MEQTDFYTENRNLFRHFRAPVFHAFEQELAREKKLDDGFKFTFFNGRNNHPTFTVGTADGREIHGHSPYDPVREAEKTFENAAFDDEDRIVLLGFGFGYHVEHLLAKTRKNIIVAVEPFVTVFEEAMKRRDLRKIFGSPRVSLGHVMEPDYLAFVIGGGVSSANLPNFRVFTLPHFRLLPDMHEMISGTIANIRDYFLFNLFTGIYAGETFFSNTVENFPVAMRNPGIAALHGRFKGKPVFVVAPGPSIEKNMDQLKRVKGRALIIAVDTATKILRTRGIVPDVIVSVDYQKENYEKLRGVDTSESFLVPSIEVCPEIPRNHNGKTFSYYHSPATAAIYDPIIGAKGLLGSGGSVLTDAFNLAVFTGGDPIILAGVDLGFPGMKFYADGSFENGRSTQLIRDGKIELIEIPDIHGNPMYTYRSFHAFLKYFNASIKSIPNKVVDATEGGARITGTEIMTLSDAIDRFCAEPYDPVAILHEAHSAFEPPDAGPLIEKIREYAEVYDRIHADAEKGLRESKKALRYIEKNRFDSALIRSLKKVRNLEEKIKKQGEYLDFMSLALERMMVTIFHFKDDESLPREERYKGIVEVSRFTFECIKNAGGMVSGSFTELIKKLSEETS